MYDITLTDLSIEVSDGRQKELSEEEKKQVEKIAEIVKMFRQIINEDGAVENNFIYSIFPAKSIDGMRSWMWIPFEQILDPEELNDLKGCGCS